MKKDNYIFPAIFDYDDDGISITFPDLKGCNTFAKTDEEALYMAKDALRGWLLVSEEFQDNIPEPSQLNNIKLEDTQRVVLIDVHLALYRNAYKNRAVKKTLTIPYWLNEIAEKEKINFSATLQEAIKSQLHL